MKGQGARASPTGLALRAKARPAVPKGASVTWSGPRGWRPEGVDVLASGALCQAIRTVDAAVVSVEPTGAFVTRRDACASGTEVFASETEAPV